ncbi:MAG: tetratricopeptide repeat protein, partial [Gammaproteobacteria bacterium]|nr:tetratricopeptide repeat protein [Gammaproteobacteria bacterium]
SSVALHQGEFEAARRWLEEALPLARAIHSSGWELTILSNLGRVLRQLGDTTSARTVSEQALVLSRLQPDPILAGRLVLQNLGRVAMQEGRLEDARAHFQAALQGLVQVRSSHLVAVCLEGLAGVAQQHGAWERAACLLGAAAGLHLATGEVEALPDRLARERVVESVRAHLGPARFEEFWGVGRTLHLEDAVAEALAIEACPAATQIKGGQLSGRERQVAALIAQGLTSAEIAERLVITPRTADTHADNIRSKLGLRSRTEIASWATAQGLSSPEAEHA